MSLEGKLYYAKDLLIHNEEWCYASPFLPYIEAVIPLLFGQERYETSNRSGENRKICSATVG